MRHVDDHNNYDVPIPAYCCVHVIDGSKKVQVVRGSSCKNLHTGCRIRIGTFNSPSEFTISTDDFHENSFSLTSPYVSIVTCEGSNVSNPSQDEQILSRDKVSIHLGHEAIHLENSLFANAKINHPHQGQSAEMNLGLRVWKLISKADDKRLLWRVQYDDGMIPWFPTYSNQRQTEYAIYFHVKHYWRDVEIACQDDECNPDECIHQQRLHYFESIPWNTIIKETYEAICAWYPISSFIDSVKWSKLAKKMNFFSSMKNVAHEVDMAFHRHSKERKMDLGGLGRVFREMAYARYPSSFYEPDEALLLFLWSTVVTIPSVNETMWRQCQVMAMHNEMIRTCGQIRIAAFWRHISLSDTFQRKRKSQKCLAKYSKMIVARKKALIIISSVKEEHESSRRRRAIILMQKEWRRYYWKKWYKNMINDQIHQQRLILEKRQQLLLEERRILSVWRIFMQSLLQTQAQMTVQRLLTYDRALLVKVPILHSSGKIFLTCVYQTKSTFVITCREKNSSVVSRSSLSYDRLYEGLSEEPTICFENQRFDRSNQTSVYNENIYPSITGQTVELGWWLLSQIIIHVDDDESKCTILLKYEVNRQKKWLQVRRIQSRWRARVALKRARCEAVCQYEKSFDRVTRLFYYVHIKTGQAQWTKPLVLGNEDVPDPPDEWRTVRYEDPENGTTCTYYENLKTGQKSWLSEDTAARMAQRQFRKMQSRALLGRVDMQKIVHAVKFTQQIQTNFSQYPDKLCNMVNYALLCHCILFDHVTAKRLYQQAVETSPHHPVICRALGLFIMSQCDDSMDRVVQESSKLFQAASEADPDHSMFQSAIDHFFSWAIVLHPKNPNAILNWALLNQMVLGDYKYADKMYRLALSVSPEHDEALRKNYDFFESQRYPGGLYASGGPPSSAVSRSRLIEEREEWGEWKKRRDPFSPKIGFEILWFNTLTKQMQFDEPRWREVWEERVKRSTCRCKSEKGLWSEYYDPLLRRTFYYSKLTDEYVCQQPHQITFIK